MPKEKLEIIIDEEEANDNFGEDTFQENIILFVEGGYKHTFEEIKEAEYTKDHAKMKITVHTLKTTVRYMASENFAQVCQSIESETKAPNWDKMLEFLPDFYEYYEILYQKALKIYNRLKNKEEDDPGPIDNFVENMIFYARDQDLKKDQNTKSGEDQRDKEKIESKIENQASGLNTFDIASNKNTTNLEKEKISNQIKGSETTHTVNKGQTNTDSTNNISFGFVSNNKNLILDNNVNESLNKNQSGNKFDSNIVFRNFSGEIKNKVGLTENTDEKEPNIGLINDEYTKKTQKLFESEDTSNISSGILYLFKIKIKINVQRSVQTIPTE